MTSDQTGSSIKWALKCAIPFLILASASLVEAQTLQTLYSFNNPEEAMPFVALTLGSDGSFYGLTPTLAGERGTVFKVTTNGTLTTLVSVDSHTTGWNTYAALTLGNDGNFYGTTPYGGSSNEGTIFQVTTNGTLTMLVSFSGTNGANPNALALGNDGNFYGTTTYGGIITTNYTYAEGMGTIFQVTTNGSLTTLVSFNSTNGAWPDAALTLGNDGNFYGTTSGGGITNSTNPYGMGTIFQVTTNGTLTTLVSFSGTNGARPYAALTLGSDGNFYGTSYGGGSNNYGTFFRVTTNGTLTTLASFSIDNSQEANPNALTLGNDGNFYGTTTYGGSSNEGTIFQVTTNGTLTTLVSFSGTNGAHPYAALTLGSDGNFYGTTFVGGITNSTDQGGLGTVFRLSLTPIITVQPHSQTVNAGLTATFLISATGLNPMGYQWQKNGTNLANGGKIAGATTDTLTIASISDSDAATYSVIVSNANRSVTSSNATLTVIDPPLIAAQPTNVLVLPGANAAFGVSVTSAAPFRYQWRFNGANLLNATNAIYSIASVGTNNAGNYAVVITNAAGTATSSNAALTVVLSPKSQTNSAGATATFTATAFGPGSLNYQWQKNGTNIAEGGNLSGTTNSTLTIASVSDADAAVYSAVVSDATGSVTTSNALLTVIDPPLITAQATNLLVLPGTDVTFGVSVTSAAPFGYQWRFNGTNLLNATNAIYSVASVGTNNAGNYAVVITNAAGTATSSNAALTVVLSPKSRTNYASSTAMFTATAFSPESLNYRWRKNGTNLVEDGNISGTTNSTLTIASVSDDDAANYNAVVSDATGSVTTSNALLTVIDPPLITAQPTNLLVLPGTNVTFGVSVTSAAPFRYQWRFNGTNLLNATNSIYSIPSVGTNNAGKYAVVITNAAGKATSSNAALTVVLSPKSRTSYASSTAMFTATAFSPESLNYRWQKNGTNLVEDGNISGTTNSTLTIASVSDDDAANYNAVVSDATGSVTTSNALLTVNDNLTIASQPQSQTVGLGSNVTFNVTAYGAPPLVFQWYFNGTPVGSPATGTKFSSYSLTNVGTNQAGNYSVLVVSDYGSLTSSNAVLTVKVFPPSIGVQPSSQSVMVGSGASFSASVSGTPPFSYQWRYNGTNLLNATNAAYVIQAVAATNTGTYSVVVTNSAGSVTSSNALLTVIVPPTLALQFLAGYPLLDLRGMLSSNFVVQYRTNLVANNWVILLSLTNLPSSPYRFLDSGGVGQPSRFYRAFME
jgi:uncharacterized repeat protein (TIGR03803 family)